MSRSLAPLLGVLLVLSLSRPATAQRVACADSTAAGYPCQNVHLWSHVPLDQLGGAADTQLNDLWGWTDGATGRRYALVGRTDGTAFVDVTKPEAPRLLGSLPTHTRSSAWRDVKVFDHFALVVADNVGAHGLQIFDLHRLRDVGDDAPVTFTEDAHYGRFGSTHNIVVDTTSGFAYAVGVSGAQDVPDGTSCGPGYHAIDVRDPLAPQFAGCFSYDGTGRRGTGYTHDAQCVVYHGPDADYRGRQICLGANETAIAIIDVTDKAAPVPVASATYPTSGYVHQGWLTEDHRFFLVNDEWDEIDSIVPRTRTLVWDVTDLEDPQLVTEYLHDTESIDHNLYVAGRYAYEANYTSGLRILDVSDPAAPQEAGFFDVFPESNAQVYAGSWSVYPFFGDDVVLVSSITGGLFVLQPDLHTQRTGTMPGVAAPFALTSVYPNPSDGRATLVLANDAAQPVRVEVFDLLGRRVQTVHAGTLSAGTHHLALDTAPLPAGLYVIRADNGTARVSRQITVAR